MATEVAKLVLQVESSQVGVAEKRLDSLSTSGGNASRATDGLTASVARLVAPLAAAATVAGTLAKVVSVQREFDILNAGLITATGSAEGAAGAFEALQAFAATTPYSLAQATEGFTKLVNMGLDPSERALRSYGNTAAAMGKDLNQMIEAVADAATGEFERLKEFGIKAKQDGDRVSLTFRGVKTEIGNNAREIEEYLTKLGENEFADSMANRMATLDGALSNLGDNWDRLFRSISQAGVGDAIADAVGVANSALDELNAGFASGEYAAYLKAYGSIWSDLSGDIQHSIKEASDFIRGILQANAAEGKTLAGSVFDTLSVLSLNTVYVLKAVGTEIGGIAAQLAALARGDFAGFSRIGDMMKADAAQARKEVDELSERILSGTKGRAASATSEFEKQMAEADRKRAEFDKKQESVDKPVLGKHHKGGKGTGDGKSSSSSKKDTSAAKAQEREFQSLQESLRTEEESIQASYEKRKAIIEKNTLAGSGLRTSLMQRLDADNAEQSRKLEDSRNADLAGLRASLMTEEEALQASYDKRLEIVRKNLAEGSAARSELEQRLKAEQDTALADLEAQKQRERDSLYSGLLTEEETLRAAYERKRELILTSESVTELERQDLMRRLKTSFDQEMYEMETARMQQQLATGQTLFDGLAGLAKAYAGEQSGAYRALFAVSKAFSIAQAGMSIATGLARAQELGFPANIAEMARVAASGASVLAQIKGSKFSGAYDNGGYIPSGSSGIVGEHGLEFVRGPAHVTSRKDTLNMIKKAANQKDEGRMNNRFNINFTVNARDAQSFAESRGKIEADISNAVSRAIRRSR